MGQSCCREAPIDYDGEVELNHFDLLRSVGKGAFGKVRIVQHKKTNQTFALKYINKAKCISMKAVDNIIQERRLLEGIESPFVCKLKFAFQDDENLFMVLELMLGGDLRFHIDRMGTMNEELVKFYICEIASGLDYLHCKRIVHRDLKPDNILLDEHGHAHLTDFNIAVMFKQDKPLTAIAGSMAYMAPEILLKKGYYSTVDWWSLGVIMYEFMFGKRPFRAKENEELNKLILAGDVIIPEEYKDDFTADALKVLKGFLTVDVNNRLATSHTGGFKAFQRHEWFTECKDKRDNINWPLLKSKSITPPFTPNSKKANFDATYELEELLLEDNPLKIRRRKNGAEERVSKYKFSTSPTAKYYLSMEEKFQVYDSTRPKGYRSYKSGNFIPVNYSKQLKVQEVSTTSDDSINGLTLVEMQKKEPESLRHLTVVQSNEKLEE